MALSKKLQAIVDKAKNTDSYWVEKIKLGFALKLESRRRSKGLSNVELAQTVGVSPAYISKVFRGDTNFTIETMVKLARATGGTLQLNIVDESFLSAPVFVPGKAERTSVTQQAQSIVVVSDEECANHSVWAHAQLAAA